MCASIFFNTHIATNKMNCLHKNSQHAQSHRQDELLAQEGERTIACGALVKKSLVCEVIHCGQTIPRRREGAWCECGARARH
jgi:hypothetical protein